MSFNETEPLLTTAEAAAQLRITMQTLRSYISSGKLKAKRLGRQHRIKPSAIQELLNAQKSE